MNGRGGACASRRGEAHRGGTQGRHEGGARRGVARGGAVRSGACRGRAEPGGGGAHRGVHRRGLVEGKCAPLCVLPLCPPLRSPSACPPLCVPHLCAPLLRAPLLRAPLCTPRLCAPGGGGGGGAPMRAGREGVHPCEQEGGRAHASRRGARANGRTHARPFCAPPPHGQTGGEHATGPGSTLLPPALPSPRSRPHAHPLRTNPRAPPQVHPPQGPRALRSRSRPCARHHPRASPYVHMHTTPGLCTPPRPARTQCKQGGAGRGEAGWIRAGVHVRKGRGTHTRGRGARVREGGAHARARGRGTRMRGEWAHVREGEGARVPSSPGGSDGTPPVFARRVSGAAHSPHLPCPLCRLGKKNVHSLCNFISQ